MILTTDKGLALVVMDKADYTKKAEELLNKPTYKKIPEDSTSRQKNKLNIYLLIEKIYKSSSKANEKRIIVMVVGHFDVHARWIQIRCACTSIIIACSVHAST